MAKKATFDRNDIYVKLTDSFINMLNMGIIPWERPWSPTNAPTNLISKKAYKGSNVWLLNAMQEIRGYKSRYWVSFKQAKDLGGNVKKGEKSTMIIYWQFSQFSKTKENGEVETKQIPLIKFSNIFNVDQCEGFEEKIPADVKNEIGTVDELEEIFANWKTKPVIHVGGDRAFYRPSTDSMAMPEKETFKDTASYYSVLGHEYIHSTGAKHRLNREGVTNLNFFGSHDYAKEELVAEMGASFFMGIAGLDRETHRNNAAYIQSWIKKLQNDPKMIVQAGSEAQKAVEYIINGGKIREEKIEENEEVQTVNELETV